MEEGVISIPFQLKILAEEKMGESFLSRSSINRSQVVTDIRKTGHFLLDLLKSGEGAKRLSLLLIGPAEIIKAL